MPLTDARIQSLASWLVKYAEDFGPDELREVIADPRFVPFVNKAIDEEENNRADFAQRDHVSGGGGGLLDQCRAAYEAKKAMRGGGNP